MPAATPLVVSDTWGSSTPLPSIRLPATGWVRPIRATTAQPWDTKREYRRDYAKTPFHVPFRIKKIDARASAASRRGRFSGPRDFFHAQPLRIFREIGNSSHGLHARAAPSAACFAACADKPRLERHARKRHSAFHLRSRERPPRRSHGRTEARHRRRRRLALLSHHPPHVWAPRDRRSPQTRCCLQHAGASDSARASCRCCSLHREHTSEMGDPGYLPPFVD